MHAMPRKTLFMSASSNSNLMKQLTSTHANMAGCSLLSSNKYQMFYNTVNSVFILQSVNINVFDVKDVIEHKSVQNMKNNVTVTFLSN